MRTVKLIGACALLMMPTLLRGETDVYGNPVMTSAVDGYDYQFWVSGDTLETATSDGSSTCSLVSSSSLEARPKTMLSAFGRIVSSVWKGMTIIFR